MSLARNVIPRTWCVLRNSSRGATAPSIQLPTGTRKTPPTLEEFDPLNPGEWQLGAGGKILPRLAIGTRCGKLVMGEYGLYDPKLRKEVEAYSKALLAGAKSEEARPFDRRLSKVTKAVAITSLLIGFWNLFVLFWGKPIWPLEGIKAPGAS